jgi:hypothetical protein
LYKLCRPVHVSPYPILCAKCPLLPNPITYQGCEGRKQKLWPS